LGKSKLKRKVEDRPSAEHAGLGQTDAAGEDVSVASRIRQSRQALGLTQEELARRIGVSRSAVAQWETDRTGQVRANLTRVAAVLGVSAGYLLAGDQNQAFLTAEGADERALLNLYRSLREDQRAELLRLAHGLAVR
jgi:transcriptional regulator with XRE-family HTH domain